MRTPAMSAMTGCTATYIPSAYAGHCYAALGQASAARLQPLLVEPAFAAEQMLPVATGKDRDVADGQRARAPLGDVFQPVPDEGVRAGEGLDLARLARIVEVPHEAERRVLGARVAAVARQVRNQALEAGELQFNYGVEIHWPPPLQYASRSIDQSGPIPRGISHMQAICRSLAPRFNARGAAPICTES